MAGKQPSYEASSLTLKIAETMLKLNEEQKEAVFASPSGVSRCIAGPGSGKTRVLISRILMLLGVLKEPPRSIMALTFTNKAGNEMKERLNSVLDQETVGKLTVGTFHSFCAKILRTYGSDYLSQLAKCSVIDNQFTIYDMNDSERIVKAILIKIGVDTKELTPDNILKAIHNLKLTLMSNVEISNKNSTSARIAQQIINDYDRELHRYNIISNYYFNIM